LLPVAGDRAVAQSGRNDDFTAEQPTPEETQEAMGRWQATMQPGVYHERLAYFVGEWDVTTKMWMAGPGSPAQETSGEAKTYWLFDGRGLAEEFKSEMMGMPFSGFSLTGYDNYRREYVGIWIDDMGTSLASMSGRLDQTGKELTMYGEMDEPMWNEMGTQVKYVNRIVDENKHVFELHDLSIGGDDTMVMEATYTRKK
jgi:hypothetical protein